jgi:cysteine-S-conjugate beta-lyase
MTHRDEQDETLIAHSGRNPSAQHGIVNPPVFHASTVLFPTVEILEAAIKTRNEPGVVYYGRFGTPTTHALEEAVAALEGGERALCVASGVGAIACVLSAFAGAGDHLLVADTAYGPTRALCAGYLKRMGIETTFYDPLIGGEIASLFRPNTRLVHMESPGSLTFEVQDVPAIASAAHRAGIPVALDNTWATPLFFKPFLHGVDVSIHAGTKYIVGHSDAMLGMIVMGDAHFAKIRATVTALGHCVGGDDAYLGLRGFRTLAVRLARHQENALALARWLRERPEVERVLHPALDGDPGHDLWRRDFNGASGLFGVVLKPISKSAVTAMLEGLRYFGMGFSWGGFESLVLPVDPRPVRSATRWAANGPALRFHAGLEAVADLIGDLERGFERMGRAARAEAAM